MDKRSTATLQRRLAECLKLTRVIQDDILRGVIGDALFALSESEFTIQGEHGVSVFATGTPSAVARTHWRRWKVAAQEKGGRWYVKAEQTGEHLFYVSQDQADFIVDLHNELLAAALSAPSSVETITEVVGQDGKPVAAPCAIDGCQYKRLVSATTRTDIEVVGIFVQRGGKWIEIEDRDMENDPDACFLYREVSATDRGTPHV